MHDTQRHAVLAIACAIALIAVSKATVGVDSKLLSQSMFNENLGGVLETWRTLQLNFATTHDVDRLLVDSVLSQATMVKSVQCLLPITISDGLTATAGELSSSNMTLCSGYLVRGEAFLLALNHIILPQSGLQVSRPLTFWYDLTSTTMLPQETYQRLKFPVLTSGKPPADLGALLIPENYRFMAMLATRPELLQQLAMKHTHIQQFAQDLAAVFAPSYTSVAPAWEDKQDVAVFRGSCMATFNPAALTGGHREVMLRGKLCQVSKNSSSAAGPAYKVPLDVGMTMKLNADQALTARCATAGDLEISGNIACSMCTACLVAGRVPKEWAIQYKYQVAVDGLGPTYDALHHKLAGNSVVFAIMQDWQPGSMPQPYHSQWFSCALTPWEHYIPTTLDRLRDHIDWCADNQAACKRIAASAVELARQLSGDEPVMEYMKLVLQHLQQWSEGEVLRPLSEGSLEEHTNSSSTVSATDNRLPLDTALAANLPQGEADTHAQAALQGQLVQVTPGSRPQKRLRRHRLRLVTHRLPFLRNRQTVDSVIGKAHSNSASGEGFGAQEQGPDDQ